MSKKISVGLICGGPSAERGISLNSARSVMDHLCGEDIDIVPFYVDLFMNFYAISPAQLYSNTPSDFDFKLAGNAVRLNEDGLVQRLKEVDIVFPAIHGAYGEDGGLQTFFDRHNIPYIGSDARCCANMFNKDRAAAVLKKNGFDVIDSQILAQGNPGNAALIKAFFDDHVLERAIVKPSAGGSSIGVSSVTTPKMAEERMNALFDQQKLCHQVLLERFCEGREFTVIVMQSPSGVPVALVPNEIRICYDDGQVFDYRRKYLPTNNTEWLCPPSFDDEIIADIRAQAEELFQVFGMRDFARLDGWLLDDGRVVFTDFNPMSGLEQNSFIFQQSTHLGFTHGEMLCKILAHACGRYGITPPSCIAPAYTGKTPVRVLFGGSTAERHVSVMSGTNAWLKLLRSNKYAPAPFFVDKDECVWALPYSYALKHTAEEIYQDCLRAEENAKRLEPLVKEIRKNLACAGEYDVRKDMPRKMSFDEFLEETAQAGAFVFLGFHGGPGEDGTYQARLDSYGIPYNGSGPEASRRGMDKNETGKCITGMHDPLIVTTPKKLVNVADLKKLSDGEVESFWRELQDDLQTDTFIIKPNSDGCSAGIIHLCSVRDLKSYINLLKTNADFAPPQTFEGQENIIEMSVDGETEYLIESFINTDEIFIRGNELAYDKKTGWLEFTVGVLEGNGDYHALSPSITVAEGDVLSLEEKFQGGTGVNITPPPENLVSVVQQKQIKQAIEKIAKHLGIENYARIDIFFNVDTGQIIVIEANTLPGLTASTVIFHQALAESPPLNPTAFLERIIDLKASSLCHEPAQNEIPSSQAAPAKASA